MAVLPAVLLLVCVASGTPDGWFLAGSAPDAYEAGVVTDAGRPGSVATLAATAAALEGFGTLMQSAQAGAFRSGHVRLTALVRTENIERWAGLWMRVDGPGSAPLALDNMADRPIMGTTDWTPYSVVLDVPDVAGALAYGVLLDGPGRVYLDEVQLEAVGPDVAPTAGTLPMRQTHPARPVNLDFEG